MLKITNLTSVWSAQHPNAVQNIQQLWVLNSNGLQIPDKNLDRVTLSGLTSTKNWLQIRMLFNFSENDDTVIIIGDKFVIVDKNV